MWWYSIRRPAASSKLRISLIAGVVATLAIGGCASSGKASGDSNQMTIMTNANVISGVTPKTSHGVNSISSWYTYYHAVWAKDLPKLKISEVQVPDIPTAVTKTLLAVNAGNPTDLIGVSDALPQLVQRGALTNLDKYYKAAGIKPSDFVPALAQFVRYNGHWYGLPGASNPTAEDLLFIPKMLTEAGLNPNAVPRTFDGLWTATQKVTEFGPNHAIKRIGIPVSGSNADMENLFCGSNATWDPKGGYHADSPCLRKYFEYEKKLIDFYGGLTAYNKFASTDPGPYGCSPKYHMATGQQLFNFSAYWEGGQIDHCYNLDWAMSWAPSQTGDINHGIRSTAWVMAVPKGAANVQAAFDFWKTTMYDNGALAGPTTNGYTRPTQAQQWDKQLSQAQSKIRAKNGYAGNPMVDALKIVDKESTIAAGSYPRGTFTSQYTTIMTEAWNNIAYNKSSIADALSGAQKQIDSKERATPGGVVVGNG
jgi:ABC-type glycerol-3-phosphate transport system substrate-binding protein